MQMVILAGGKGTRLGKLTSNTPKSMIEIKGEPFLEYQIELVKVYGITDIILCTGYLHRHIERYFKDGSEFGVNIRYSKDNELGTFGAIKYVEKWLDDKFFVMYGDSYLPTDFNEVEDAFEDFPAMMTVYKNKGKYDRSNVFYHNGLIIKYGYHDYMTYIDYGLSILTRDCLGYLGKDLGDLFKQLIETDQLQGYEVFERFYEIGSLEGLNDFERYVDDNI